MRRPEPISGQRPDREMLTDREAESRPPDIYVTQWHDQDGHHTAHHLTVEAAVQHALTLTARRPDGNQLDPRRVAVFAMTDPKGITT